MKIDRVIAARDPKSALAEASAAEHDGCAGVWISEAAHDPFLPLASVATSTETIEFGTAIAIAFARSPMTLASTAYDLQAWSGGRFVLGLGSQIRPHITRRFSMPWSAPAARMREFVLAMHAIWDCWATGEPLEFIGEFYRHTLMTPMFNPGPLPVGVNPPDVYVAGVGPLMTAVAGEVAGGLFVHPFTSPSYLEAETMPALDSGLGISGRDRTQFDVGLAVMVATGRTAAEIDAAADRIRHQIAFYGSTPAYRPILDHHGWGDLQPQLNKLSKAGEWSKMTKLISDEILHTFAAVGTPSEVASTVTSRWHGLIDRVSLSSFGGDLEMVGEVTAALTKLQPTQSA